MLSVNDISPRLSQAVNRMSKTSKLITHALSKSMANAKAN